MLHSISYESAVQGPSYRRAQFWCALAVMVSVFPLIWMGGLVTSHGAGMSVPDWPNSYGYNMFLFPPSKWIGGIFYEHTHRLLGTLSGLLSIALVMLAWGPGRKPGMRYGIGVFTIAMFLLVLVCLGLKLYLATASQLTYEFKKSFSNVYMLFGCLGLVGLLAWLCRRREQRQWVRWLTVVQLVAVIIQGTLGGLRVTEVNTTLAIIHGCFAQAFFCLTAFTALAMSRWWINYRDETAPADAQAGRFALKLAGISVVLIFLQLTAGATMRHYQAGLAIPDLPLAFGKVLPPTTEAGLEQANAMRVWTYHLAPATLTQIWLHFGHRVGAVLVTLAIGILGFHVFRNLRSRPSIVMLASVLWLLVAVQFTLGVLTVYWSKPADIASLHVAVGATTLMFTTLTAAVIGRQFARSKAIALATEPAGDNPTGWVTA